MEVESQGPGLLALLGILLIAIGVLSRLFSLGLYRRVSASPARDVTPSLLPGTPWFTVESDQNALRVIVRVTYAAVIIGMVLVLIGVLSSSGQ